jgi:hypothetical protein
MTSCGEEFHHQLREAVGRLSAALSTDDPFLIAIARANLSEISEIARRHYGLDASPPDLPRAQQDHSRRPSALQPVA